MRLRQLVHRASGMALMASLVVTEAGPTLASDSEKLYGIMSDGVSTTSTFAEVSTTTGQVTPIFSFTRPYYVSALGYDKNTGKFVALAQIGSGPSLVGMVVEIDAVAQTIEEHVISGLPFSPFTNFVGMEFDPTLYDSAQTACDHVLVTYGQDTNSNLENRIAAVNSSTGAVFDYTEPPLAVSDADIIVFNPATSQLIDADTNNPPFEAISNVFGAAPGITTYASPYNDPELYDSACAFDGTMYFSRRATLDLWKLDAAGTGYTRIGPHLFTPGAWAFGLAVGPALDKLVPVCGNGTQDAGELCDDGNTNDGDGCSSCCTPEPCTGACDDGNACNGVETCDPATGCVAGTPPICDDGNFCNGYETCDPAIGCVAGTPVGGCDDGNACNGVETCNPASGCVAGTPLVCNDGNACTADACNPATGCTHTPITCNDGNACNGVETCNPSSGCVSGTPVFCAAPDQCHVAGVCAPATGLCSYGNKPNGTTCNDGNPATSPDTCTGGVCSGPSACTSNHRPKTKSYYQHLCSCTHSGHHNDSIADADAACVGSISDTFAGFTTVSQVCHVLDGDHDHFDDWSRSDCSKAEDELIALALNICKHRVCPSDGIDTKCDENGHSDDLQFHHNHGGHDDDDDDTNNGETSTVGASFDTADGLLDDPSRTNTECKQAACLAKEINNGHALEFASLIARRDGANLRLTWLAPILDDGTAHPSSYKIWRRDSNSTAPFVQIGSTAGLTYLDSTGGTTVSWEYDVTPVMPAD